MTATTLRLYGPMGTKFGRVHHVYLDTNTPAEAVRYLCSQFPKARAYLTGAKDRGVGFAVFRGKENLDRDQLNEPVGNDDIRIAPIIMGSKNNGWVNIIIGIVLVVVSFFDYGLTSEQAGAFLAAGIGEIAGGVVQLLTPVPRAPSNADSPDNKPSYIFSGAVNT